MSDPAQRRQHQFPGKRLGVHAEIENPHGDTLTFQRLKNCHQIRDRASKPMQLGDDENIAIPGNGCASVPLPSPTISTTASRVRGRLIEACEMMVNSGKACLASESCLGLDMTIPTEPIGSIPRPQRVITAFEQYERESLSREEFESICSEAVRETIEKFEATGSPVITDGEQTKPSFATYPIDGLSNLNPDGVKIQFADGHVRQLPKLSSGPFRYKTYASSYLKAAKKFTRIPIKQAVISPSALSLLYPSDGIPNYPQEKFLEDLVKESATDIRGCLDNGAHCVQIDFTEGRLAVKLDPSGQLLSSFIALINRVLDQFSQEERKRIGVHTCPRRRSRFDAQRRR